MEKEIEDFFVRNWTGEVKNNIVWDTFKAYVRGILISLGAREKKIKEKNLKELQKKD